jgi:ribosomal protein S12 methylthiotransferase accessory factor
LLERLRACGYQVLVQHLTGDIGVPTFRTIILDTHFPSDANDGVMLSSGWGTAPVAELAVLRSITEAVQSRVGTIQGARDSYNLSGPRLTPASRRRRLSWWEADRSSSFNNIPSFVAGDLRDYLTFLLERLSQAGLRHVVAVDLTREDLAIPVVRVRIPGLSCFQVNQRRVDWRCLRHLL